MINYKKSLLSLATILAIGSSSVSADYIPLSVEGHTTNSPWVLFGVNGFVSEGSSSSSSTIAGEFSITDNDLNTAKDISDPVDELYGADSSTDTDGRQFIDASSNSLGKVKSLSATRLEVRIDLTDIVFQQRDPERIIYVSKNNSSPVFSLKYRASLEGKTVQFSTASDGSDVYTFVISSENTYSNPAVATPVIASSSTSADGTFLTDLSDIVDFNLTDNPLSISYFDKDIHQQGIDSSVAGKNLRVYSYDAIGSFWKLYDSRNTEASNDFKSLEKAKAYWARIDDNGTKAKAGLVLGSSTLTATDYENAAITDGWNLIAFDGIKSDLRVSTTGMIIDLIADGALNIKDTTKEHTVTVSGLLTGNIPASCLKINQAIKSAKIAGTVSDTLDLKAFPSEGTKIALISNKRFILEEDVDATIGSATTLTGGNLLRVNTLIDETNSTANFTSSASGLQSKYGEYALVIEPLLGTDTAADLNTSSFNIVSTVASSFNKKVDLNKTATLTTLSTMVTALDIKINAIELDLDHNVTVGSDSMLIASTEPFYVRDHTFTRVFDYTVANDANGTINIISNGTGDVFYTTEINSTLANAESNITALTGVSADANVSGDLKLYVLVNTVGGNEFYVTEDANADKLKDATSALDIAKGAIKGVYSLDYLAKRSLSNTIVLDLDIAIVDNNVSLNNESIEFSFNGESNTSKFFISTGLGKDDNVTVFNEIVVNLKKELADSLISASVEHNCTGDADSAAIIITSPDLTSLEATTTSPSNTDYELQINGAAGTANATATLGYIDSATPDLIGDLKYNAIYTPDYVTAGPLYTLRDAGFKIKAMVTGTMDLNSSNISWESVDLTKKPSEWLDSQDYNLFNVDASSGYWAYLQTLPEATLTVSNPNFKPNYKYHFNVDGTTFNTISGNLAVEIGGMDEADIADNRASAVVEAYVAGSIVSLARTGSSNVYTGKISSYTVSDLTSGADYEIFINASDGLGSNLKSASAGVNIDFTPPVAPVITETSGSFAFTSTSADAVSFYIFKGKISEKSTTLESNNFLVNLDTATAAAYTLCDKLDAIEEFSSSATAKTDPYTLRVFAMDGTGTLGGGNASDITSKTYLPMLKSAMLLTDVNDDESDPVTYESAGTVKYTDTCIAATENTTNYGITLTSESSYTTVKLAFNYVENRDTTGTPLTMFIQNGSEAVAKIIYPESYAGERVYTEVGDKVFALKLQTDAELQVQGDNSDNAIPLGADVNVSKELINISL